MRRECSASNWRIAVSVPIRGPVALNLAKFSGIDFDLSQIQRLERKQPVVCNTPIHRVGANAQEFRFFEDVQCPHVELTINATRGDLANQVEATRKDLLGKADAQFSTIQSESFLQITEFRSMADRRLVGDTLARAYIRGIAEHYATDRDYAAKILQLAHGPHVAAAIVEARQRAADRGGI